MNLLKKIFGIAPQKESDGSFIPSPLALKLATSNKTDFDGGNYPRKYEGKFHKILMLCTEKKNMKMKNGKEFSTGNHPVEMGLPMLHFLKAGFEVDIATPTGEEVQIEYWAMPKDDIAVKELFRDFKNDFKNPKSYMDVLTSLDEASPYIGVFIPGGHGAMLDLPEDKNLGKILHWAHDNDRFTLAICHGPAALLAASLDKDKAFPYQGYKIAAFPDSVDKQTPIIGYMPGHMPWKFGEKLEALDLEIINKKADQSCHADRKLITGASPQAANSFGRLVVTKLLEN